MHLISGVDNGIDCGRRTAGENQLDSYIESSSVATDAAWPWHAALLRDGRYHCSATVISRRWLLTSARCLLYVLYLTTACAVAPPRTGLALSPILHPAKCRLPPAWQRLFENQGVINPTVLSFGRFCSPNLQSPELQYLDYDIAPGYSPPNGNSSGAATHYCISVTLLKQNMSCLASHAHDRSGVDRCYLRTNIFNTVQQTNFLQWPASVLLCVYASVMHVCCFILRYVHVIIALHTCALYRVCVTCYSVMRMCVWQTIPNFPLASHQFLMWFLYIAQNCSRRSTGTSTLLVLIL